ncbi:universal stress protein [Planosporangium thailandense]|uniref:Universal stress protein n=1 Tax=Planosporangium thailandense TaxID=765197 RepID=A0ABX0XZ65_9ACTN|nr:universal stress protein [Planosporangium thailandense]NJC71370.1 universal stress protein [Planosporangium thailandense]
MSQPIVVGVDGSSQSLDAVDLAVREAAMRDLPLRVVSAFTRPDLGVPGVRAAYPPEADVRLEAERIVREAMGRAAANAPALDVGGDAVEGPPATTLIDQSRAAALVVVGNRGLGGFKGLLVGSVAVELTAHAGCPVLVARGRASPSGDVLAGVDGSPLSDMAVRFAFEEAALRGSDLTAVYAWTMPARVVPVVGTPSVDCASEVEAAHEHVLSKAISNWRDAYPAVPVRGRLVHTGARQALLKAAEEAQLVVVGSRGRGGFAGLLLGSVSQAMLHHATCPVAIVRDTQIPGRSS